MTASPPFMDVVVDGDAVELPRLKLRELLFVGALRADGNDLVRDASRPLPPFRLPGLFPPGARFSREDRGPRVRLRRLPGPPAAPAPPAGGTLEAELGRRAEAALPPPGAEELVWSPWSAPPAPEALRAADIVRFEHVYGGARVTPVPDGTIVWADDDESRFAVAAPGSAAADALRRAGFELIYGRLVTRRPRPEPGAGA